MVDFWGGEKTRWRIGWGFQAHVLATLRACVAMPGLAWEEVVKVVKAQQLVSSSLTKAWCWTKKICECPLYFFCHNTKTLGTSDVIMVQYSSWGLGYNMYGISVALKAWNVLAIRPLVLFELALWQSARSWNLIEKEHCKPRSFANRAVSIGVPFIKRVLVERDTYRQE